MSDTDRGWFRKNPNANFRVRDPQPGELDYLLRQLSPVVGIELDRFGGVLPPDQLKYNVAVVKVPGGKTLRLLTTAEVEGGEITTGVICFALVCAGQRVVIA